MQLRTIETRLAALTLAGLAVFAPLETIATWQMLGGPRGLIHPAYVVTFTGMVLMLVGATHSLKARPRPAPALLCVAHAWLAAYGVRAALWRFAQVRRGVELHYGAAELWGTAFAAAAILALLVVSLFLTYRAAPAAMPPASRRIETQLAFLTLFGLAVFAPIETAATWQFGGGARALIHPWFVPKVAGMLLLFFGAKHSLAARPRSAPGVMCASHAWWAATGWGATVGRIHAMSQGTELHWGTGELWAVAAGAAVTLGAFALSFSLTYRVSSATEGGAVAPTAV